MEATGANRRLVMEANEALGMESLVQSVDAIMFDGLSALGASGSEVLLVLILAEELTTLFNEADVLKRNSGVGADEGLGRERLAQGEDEGTSDFLSTDGADGDFAREDGLLHLGASSGS